MKPSIELFQLIKSLSRSEKRYFKLLSTLQSGTKNYMKLFDAIDLQGHYDELDIKVQFADENFVNHLPAQKNNLYGLILKSLRSFYADKSVAAILQEQIRNVELLMDKALYKECGKIIRKAKAIAYAYEKYYFLIDLIDLEKSLVEEEYLRGDFAKDLTKLVKEENECLKKLKNIAEYQILYSKINYVFRTGGYIRTAEEKEIIDKITNHKLIKNEKLALSIKAATACYYVRGLCAYTERELDTAHLNFKRVVQIMEDNPKIRCDLPSRYVKALNNLMFSYMDYEDWDNALKIITKLKSLATQKGFESIGIQLKLFTFSNNAELLISLTRGNFHKAITSVVPSVLRGIEKYDLKINDEEIMLFYYNISRVYFGARDYKNALKYINLVLNNSEKGLRKDVYTFARLINLIIHYQLENYNLLDYTIKSAKRFVTKTENDYKFETVFVLGFKKILKNRNPRLVKGVYKSFKKELQKVLKDPYEQAANEYFDFIAWIDSRIENKTFEEIIKRKQT